MNKVAKTRRTTMIPTVNHSAFEVGRLLLSSISFPNLKTIRGGLEQRVRSKSFRTLSTPIEVRDFPRSKLVAETRIDSDRRKSVTSIDVDDRRHRSETRRPSTFSTGVTIIDINRSGDQHRSSKRPSGHRLRKPKRRRLSRPSPIGIDPGSGHQLRNQK
jgi:hypothetical protein